MYVTCYSKNKYTYCRIPEDMILNYSLNFHTDFNCEDRVSWALHHYNITFMWRTNQLLKFNKAKPNSDFLFANLI